MRQGIEIDEPISADCVEFDPSNCPEEVIPATTLEAQTAIENLCTALLGLVNNILFDSTCDPLLEKLEDGTVNFLGEC